jgi:hypothetical protein
MEGTGHTDSRTRRVHRVVQSALFEEALNLCDFFGNGRCWGSERDETEVCCTR